MSSNAPLHLKHHQQHGSRDAADSDDDGSKIDDYEDVRNFDEESDLKLTSPSRVTRMPSVVVDGTSGVQVPPPPPPPVLHSAIGNSVTHHPPYPASTTIVTTAATTTTQGSSSPSKAMNTSTKRSKVTSDDTVTNVATAVSSTTAISGDSWLIRQVDREPLVSQIAQYANMELDSSLGKRPPRDMKRLDTNAWHVVCKASKWGTTPALFLRNVSNPQDVGFFKPPELFYSFPFEVGDQVQVSDITYSTSRNKVASSIRIKLTMMHTAFPDKALWRIPTSPSNSQERAQQQAKVTHKKKSPTALQNTRTSSIGTANSQTHHQLSSHPLQPTTTSTPYFYDTSGISAAQAAAMMPRGGWVPPSVVSQAPPPSSASSGRNNPGNSGGGGGNYTNSPSLQGYPSALDVSYGLSSPSLNPSSSFVQLLPSMTSAFNSDGSFYFAGLGGGGITSVGSFHSQTGPPTTSGSGYMILGGNNNDANNVTRQQQQQQSVPPPGVLVSSSSSTQSNVPSTNNKASTATSHGNSPSLTTTGYQPSSGGPYAAQMVAAPPPSAPSNGQPGQITRTFSGGIFSRQSIPSMSDLFTSSFAGLDSLPSFRIQGPGSQQTSPYLQGTYVSATQPPPPSSNSSPSMPANPSNDPTTLSPSITVSSPGPIMLDRSPRKETRQQ